MRLSSDFFLGNYQHASTGGFSWGKQLINSSGIYLRISGVKRDINSVVTSAIAFKIIPFFFFIHSLIECQIALGSKGGFPAV